MELTPTDIRDRTFTQSLRGVDADEVETFLHRIADEVEALVKSRDQMQERVERLEDKLDKIGDATGKIRTAKSRLDQRRSKIEAEETRLAEKRKELAADERQIEEQREAVLVLIARLQGVMRREVNNLQVLADGHIPDEATVRSPVAQNSVAGASGDGRAREDGSSEEREKSTEEWIDSLFPNRLGAGDGAVSDDSPSAHPSENTSAPSGQRSESQSQFEAIKQDVQSRSTSSTSSVHTSEDPDEPSTSELHRIWDIFEE